MAIYDLEERTEKFGELVIDFAKGLPRNVVTNPLISQFVRSGTAVGASYCEADCAESKKDFEHKLGISAKESKETKHWMRMAVRAVPECTEEARALWKEADELQRIFLTIIKKSRQNNLSNSQT
jgi:four helix bundle protein